MYDLDKSFPSLTPDILCLSLIYVVEKLHLL